MVVQTCRNARSNVRCVKKLLAGRTYLVQWGANRPGTAFPSSVFTDQHRLSFLLRRDLLKRHAACHSDGGNSAIRRRRQHNQAWRVSQACKPCAAAKLKCDEEKPCGRCVERGIPCEREERNQPRQARTDVSQQTSRTAHHPYYLTWLLLAIVDCRMQSHGTSIGSALMLTSPLSSAYGIAGTFASCCGTTTRARNHTCRDAFG